MRLAAVFLSAILFTFSGCTSEIEQPDPPELSEFSFPGVSVVSVSIDQTRKRVNVILPYQTRVNELVPVLKVIEDTAIVPASGVRQDFSSPVYYTLIANGGRKSVYTIEVSIEEQPAPLILAFEKDTVEAGTALGLSGRNFGNFQPDIQAYLIDQTGKTLRLDTKLLDSTRLRAAVPSELAPGWYSFKLIVRKKEVIPSTKLRITYPAPQLRHLGRRNILAGDTLWADATFADSQLYDFQLGLWSGQSVRLVEQVAEKTAGKGFLTDKNLPEGTYEVRLYNKTEQKWSRTAIPIQVYGRNKPFVTSLLNSREMFREDDALIFSTVNFEQYPIRFYQAVFSEGGKVFTVNGLYNEESETLQVNIPAGIAAGKYQLAFLLSDPARSYSRQFNTDITVRIGQP